MYSRSTEREVIQMTILFSNVPMVSVFKYNNVLYVRTGTNTARNIYTKEVVEIPLTERVIIF